MARKLTAMDVRTVAALARGVDDGAGFCRVQGISRQTCDKGKKRFETAGLDGLRERSRRPTSVPIATPADVEHAVVRSRKELAEQGGFNRPMSIAARLAGAGLTMPSRATIARILRTPTLTSPQPAQSACHARPTSSKKSRSNTR